MRQYTKDVGKPDYDLEKFAINSVISATHTSEMGSEDQKDIISKIKKAGEQEEGHEDEMELDADIENELGGDEPEIEEAAVRDLEAEKESGKPNLRVYVQNPHAEKYVKEDDDEDYGDEDWERASREVEYGISSESEGEDMFFQNVKNMKSDAEKILSMDKDKIKKKLRGHDWAKDHISTSTDDADEVSNFLSSGDAVAESLFEKLIQELKSESILGEDYDLNISEVKHRGKNVKLNSPMKNSGGKPYKVYVKNKKGNIITVQFGSGMRAKLSDKKAKERYNKRHGCSKGRHNDKTKAGYWSCRLPRYAKKLGLSGGGTWW